MIHMLYYISEDQKFISKSLILNDQRCWFHLIHEGSGSILFSDLYVHTHIIYTNWRLNRVCVTLN